MASGTQADRNTAVTAARLLFGRRVLNQRITSAALLVGVLLGGVIGAALGAWLAGVWIGFVLGVAAPRLVALGIDLTGRLPGWALYRRHPS